MGGCFYFNFVLFCFADPYRSISLLGDESPPAGLPNPPPFSENDLNPPTPSVIVSTNCLAGVLTVRDYVYFFPLSYCPVSFCLDLSCLLFSHFGLSRLDSFCPLSLCPVSSCLVLSCFVLSHFAPSRLVLPHHVKIQQLTNSSCPPEFISFGPLPSSSVSLCPAELVLSNRSICLVLSCFVISLCRKWSGLVLFHLVLFGLTSSCPVSS